MGIAYLVWMQNDLTCAQATYISQRHRFFHRCVERGAPHLQRAESAYVLPQCFPSCRTAYHFYLLAILEV